MNVKKNPSACAYKDKIRKSKAQNKILLFFTYKAFKGIFDSNKKGNQGKNYSMGRKIGR